MLSAPPMEFENLEPMGQALPYGFLGFVRAMHLCIELSDIGSDLLLGLRLGLAGEYFAAFDSLLVKVPDDALPAAIGSSEDVTVGRESFLWHGWWFLLPGCFINHQHYRIAPAYVHPHVLN